MRKTLWIGSLFRGYRVVLAGLIVSLYLLSLPVSAETLVYDYAFEKPEVLNVIIGQQTFDRIDMPNGPNTGDVGEPALPSQGVRILLPPGSELSNIEILQGERELIGSDYFIEPVRRPYILSQQQTTVNPTRPDRTIYESDSPFPYTRHETHGTQLFRGFPILVLELRPVEYLPTTGELWYYPQMRVVVKTTTSLQRQQLYRNSSRDAGLLSSEVDNPEQITGYLTNANHPAENFDLLILTLPELVPGFWALKEFHDTTGILTEIRTITDVGSSDPDDIRDYITSCYINDGIQYVLIGGDDNTIPAKDLYVVAWDEEDDVLIEENMPADLYYACLDGTYNFDGDDRWGEPGDGEAGGEIDLLADVYVGRASVDNQDDVHIFVNKTIKFITTTDTYVQNVLLCGEHLGFSGTGEYGGYSIDQLVNGSTADGNTTVGFPSTLYNIDKLYDRDWPGNDWYSPEVISRINDGVQIVNHLGHCNENWAMKLSRTTVLNSLTNQKHCFIYSQGCLAGRFDMNDCWAEVNNTWTEYGAFALVMNARYGLGDYGTDGPSHRFNREFWDAVYNPTENKPQLGRAHHDSKEDNIYRIDDVGMRYCYYQTTLFGDPTVRVRTNPSLIFSYPDGIPSSVTPQQTYPLAVDIVNVCGGNMTPGSGQLHYSIDGNPEQTAAMMETGPDQFEAHLPGVACGSSLEFYISAQETTTGTLRDPETVSYSYLVTPVSDTTVIFSDDFETDKGWTTTDAEWQLGIPTGGGGLQQQYGGEDPTEGHSDQNVYGYNLNGDYDNSLPAGYLTSPVIDCTDMENVHLKFWRWLGVEDPARDRASIEVSDNGTDWSTIWENSSIICDNEWVPVEIDISEFADNQPTIYLRWVMGPTSSMTSYCGWNVDDVELLSYPCLAPPSCCLAPTVGDLDQSGEPMPMNVNGVDLSLMIDMLFLSLQPVDCMDEADIDRSGYPDSELMDVDGVDLSMMIDNLFISLTPLPTCP